MDFNAFAYSIRHRQQGQGGAAETQKRDLRAQLQAAEAAHYAKIKGAPIATDGDGIGDDGSSTTAKRSIESAKQREEEDEDVDAKRRRVLEETREIDADSDRSSSSGSDSSDEER